MSHPYKPQVVLVRLLSRALSNETPGALAFQRDMFLDVPLIADIMTLSQRCQLMVDQALHYANQRRISHDYQVNERVLVRVTDPSKMDEKFIGPFRITQVHVNGNVTIRRSPNVTERINIRRLKPYRS